MDVTRLKRIPGLEKTPDFFELENMESYQIGEVDDCYFGVLLLEHTGVLRDIVEDSGRLGSLLDHYEMKFPLLQKPFTGALS